MTSERQNDAAPAEGRDAALALLASRLSQMGERVGELAGRVQTAEAAIRGQGETVAEAAGAGVGGEGEAGGGPGGPAPGVPPLVRGLRRAGRAGGGGVPAGPPAK